MNLPQDVIDDVMHRLRRVEGQVQGIQRMIDSGRDCREVVIQVSAASHALQQVGFKIIACGMRYCIADPEEAEAAGYDVATVEQMLLKLA